MKRGKHTINTEERLEFDMTPMIDCCFQLIIFFMLTLRFSYQEGDFNIRMPLAGAVAKQVDDLQSPTIKVRLTANSRGELTGITMGDRKLRGFKDLHQQIRGMVRPNPRPGTGGDQEVEFDCDYKLKYDHVVQGITAVSGYLADDGKTVVKLIEKVKFAQIRPKQ